MGQTFQDHFSSVANRYADFRPHYPAALFDYLVTLVPRNSVVWDCACGNGQATRDRAARFNKIIATDASSEQIAAAPRLSNVEFRVASAEQSNLPDQSVALVTVAQAIHWFNFGHFYAEVKRVLVPRGIIAAWSYGIDEVEGEAVDRLAQHFYHEVVGPYWPPERKIVEGDGYRAMPFPFEEIAAPSFQMVAHWTLDQLLGYFSTWSSTSRYIKATGQNPIEPLREAMARVWGDVNSPRQVTWPLAFRVGRL